MVKERAKSLKAQEEKIAALMAKLQREKAKEVSSLYRYWKGDSPQRHFVFATKGRIFNFLNLFYSTHSQIYKENITKKENKHDIDIYRIFKKRIPFTRGDVILLVALSTNRSMLDNTRYSYLVFGYGYRKCWFTPRLFPMVENKMLHVKEKAYEVLYKISFLISIVHSLMATMAIVVVVVLLMTEYSWPFW